MDKNVKNSGLIVQGTENQEIKVNNVSQELAEKILKIHQMRVNYNSLGLRDKETTINFDYNQGQYDRGVNGFYAFLSELTWLDLSQSNIDFFARMQLNNYSSVIEVYGKTIYKNADSEPAQKEVYPEAVAPI